MRFYKIIFALILLMPLVPAQFANAAGQCYCYTEFGLGTDADAICSSNLQPDCSAGQVGAKFVDCTWQNTVADCDAKVVKWKENHDTFLASQTIRTQQQAQTQAGGGLIYKALPKCLFDEKWDPKGECADVSIFVTTLINLGASLFTVIGGLALVMFIYGGFVLILSQGNPEEVKKGTGVMVAAVTGLVIAFGGYVLVKFLGDAVALKSGFGLK